MAWKSSTHHVVDPQSGQAHIVSIDLPHRHERLDELPVIVCLDGAWTSGTVRDATRVMSMGGEAPEAAVVGVSFDDPSMAAYLRLRACWYTPTQWVPPPETGVRDVTAAQTGRAGDYVTFLREHVLTLVADETDIAQTWLLGHSFSALCGLHVLFTEPETFDRYLLASPSIWWHDRAILDLEQKWADEHTELPATVFLSAGENEGGTKFDDDTYRMSANVLELRDRLGARDHAGLDLSCAVLPGESHNSTIGASIAAGLRALHAPDTLVAVGDTRVEKVVSTPGS